MDGPKLVSTGKAGTLTIGGLRAGRLTAWRVTVSSKSTAEQVQYVLFADGAIGRFFGQTVGGQATANLVPTAAPARIGRKKPPVPKPFVLGGRIVEISPRRVVIAEGEVLTGT